jgi:tRNA guanosine-2'-O-methyltransferase
LLFYLRLLILLSTQNLLSWLGKRQEEGYTIVGLEQTSSSTSIENYQFPEKTVLLLGKEKEGIPVEFLQLVDQCVEIPQLGIIRSLNVHVSGAICIWEYSKQLLSRSSEAAP